MAFADRDGRVTAWNAAAARVFGLSEEAVLGRPLPLPVPPELPRWAASLARAQAGETLDLLDFRFDGPAGIQRDVRVSLVPQPDAGGLALLAQDVTEKRAAARRSAEELHRLSVVLEAIPMPIFFKDAAGVYRGCNRAFEEYLGHPRDRICGQAVEGISSPELARVYRRADDELFASGGTQSYEAQVRWAGGSLRDVLFHKAVFQSDDGSLGGLVGSILDITERKRAEEALRVGERKFRAAFDHATVGLVLVGPEARFLEFNPAFLEMLGYSAEELRALTLSEVLHPDDRFAGLEGFRSLAAGERDHVEAERRFVRQDGAVRHLRYGVSPIRDDLGCFQSAVAVVEDVTDKVLATQALRDSEVRASVAGRLASLGTLAAGVAHEINNPLAYVVANLDFARETLAREGDPELRQALDDAAEGAGRVSRIVQDLKGFARVDDARERVDLTRVLRSAANLAGAEVKRRGKLVVDLPPLPPVSGSSARLGQVFLNLLVNAAQALPEDEPERHEVRLRARASGDSVVVEVEDTGAGIDPSIRSRIFDPFFTTKPVGIGTGLGLAISHRIVADMGGTIEVESAPGEGAIFRVCLPLAAASAESAA